MGIFVSAIIILISLSGFFQKYEYMLLDNMFRLRGERQTNEDIVIVGIDDRSLEILGRWPWPRDFHASFLQVLNKYNPRFVMFDILFPESDPGGDAVLAMVAREEKNLYLASYFILEEDTATAADAPDDFHIPALQPLNYEITGKEKFLYASDITLPVKILMDAARGITIVNMPQDIDGSTRHVPLVIEFGGKLYPTFCLQLACDYLGIDLNDVIIKPGVIILPHGEGDIHIPIDPAGKMLLNFNGSIDAFEQYSYIQLLHDYNKSLKEGTKSILENLDGKIIFVGQTATGTVDIRLMPFSNHCPAIALNATAVGNILDRDLISKSPAVLNFSIILIVSGLLSLVVKRGKKAFVNLTVMIALFLSYAVLSFISFIYLNFWVHTFTPLATILFAYVAISINHYEAVRYEKKVLENELLIARKIQQSFLPKTYPEVPFLEFAARCSPAKHVGGDLYDFAQLEDEHIGVTIGDVSGKGIPAALYMARAISEFRTASRLHLDAAGTLKAINETFAKEGMEKAFITMQYLMFEVKSKRLILSNGGHNTVLHFKKQQNKIEEIDTEGGMPIGIMEGIDFDNKEVGFDKGDILFLYTDGVSEAMDKRHKEFGLDRVKNILMNSLGLSSEQILAKTFNEIEKFSKGTDQHDDITVIVIRAV